MTSEDRQLTALRGGTPDRVPVMAWLNPFLPRWATGIRASVDPVAAGYADVLEAARDLADPEFDWGFPAGFFYSAYDTRTTSERVGPERVRYTAQTPRGPLTSVVQDRSGGGTEKHWIETVEDARRLLSIPYEPVEPDLAPFHATRAESSGRYISKVTLADPSCTVGLIDPMVCAFWTREERPLLEEILEVAFERISASLDYLLRGGVGPLYYFNGPEYCLPPLMSPDDFEQFVVAYDTRLIAQIHAFGQITQIHSHGRVNRFLERFAATGTDSLNVLEPPPLGDVILAEAKQRIGDRVCLVGNIQYDDLAAATSANEVDEMVHACVEQGKPGGGFLLALCAAPYEVPLPEKAARNLISYMEAGRRYGQY